MRQRGNLFDEKTDTHCETAREPKWRKSGSKGHYPKERKGHCRLTTIKNISVGHTPALGEVWSP